MKPARRLDPPQRVIAAQRGSYALVPPARLREFVLAPELTLESWVCPRGAGTGADIVVHASSRARYQLSLDPVGTLRFTPRKPRTWMMVREVAGFPGSGLTLDLMVCPFRGNSSATLLSYVTGRDGVAVDFALREHGRDGLTVVINDQSISAGVYLDYAQWQRVSVTWDGQSGALAIYKDDGPAVIKADGSNSLQVVPFGPPVFEATFAPGQHIADHGTLVLGHDQGRPGDILGFNMARAYAGGMGELRLWRRPLNRAELNRHKGSLPTGDEPGLVGCWQFTGRGLASGECRNICVDGHNHGALGGFAEDQGVCDPMAYRLLGVVGSQAVLSCKLIPAGQWSHVALVARRPADALEGGRTPAQHALSLFIDGRPVPTYRLPASELILPEVGTGRIGPLDEGAFDVLRLWRCARSADEIDRDRKVREPPATDGLLAWYDGVAIERDVLHDRTGNGHDLIITEPLRACADAEGKPRSAAE